MPAASFYTPIEQIPQIHQQLQQAFRSRRSRPVAYRRQQLLQLLHLIQDNEERFQKAFNADLGRSLEEASLLEITGTLQEVGEAYESVEKWTSPERPPFDINWFAMSPQVRKEPKGVVLIIGPFNYPLYLVVCSFASAIAAGNAVMVKPSELSPATATLLAELVPKYLDPEMYHVVNGGVPETTKVLELSFNHILYTGNGRIGRIICEAAAKHLTPVTLELGGKSPCVIDPRCDVKVAAKRIMWGKLLNGGQLCLSPDYVLVPAWFQDTFVEALKNAYYELHPTDPKVSGLVCRMVNERHAERVKRLIDNTQGRIVFGGEVDVEARYAAPSLIKDVRKDDSLMSEEIFGPFLAVVPVEDVDEAIEFINAGDRPLNIYVFSNDPSFKGKVIDNTQSGTVFVNDTVWQCGVHGAPFGGTGASGYGYTTGKHAFLTFTHLRCTADNPNWVDSVLLSGRYTPWKPAAVQRLIKMLRPRVPPHDQQHGSSASRLGVAIAIGLMGAALTYFLNVPMPRSFSRA